MEDVRFILLEKLEKIKTPQWLWIVAAVILIGAVALWAVHYRRVQGKKGVKILAILAAFFFAAVFAAQMIAIMTLSPLKKEAIALDDVSVSVKNGAAVNVEKTVTSEPKDGAVYQVGEKVQYTVTVRNEGESTAEGIALSDGASWEEWEIEKLEPGESSEKELGFKVEYDSGVLPKTISYLLPAIAILAGFVLFIAGICVGVSDRQAIPQKVDVRALTYGAICVAMSFVLSYIKLFSAPQGGSVTLASMLPIMLYAYLYGTKRGLLVGLVYGLLQFIQKPEITHWAQVLLDYPVAFAAIGLAGISKHIPAKFMKLPIGTIIGGVARWIVHTVSGFLFFSEILNGDALKFSAVYNGWYMLFDTLICFVLAFPVAAIVKRAGIGPQEEKKLAR